MVLAVVSNCCTSPRGKFSRVTHPFATRLSKASFAKDLVRLACLIHAASVRSEPESNSPKRKYVVFAGKPAMTNILTGNGVPTFKHPFYRAPHRFKRAVRNAQISFFNFLSILLESEDLSLIEPVFSKIKLPLKLQRLRHQLVATPFEVLVGSLTSSSQGGGNYSLVVIMVKRFYGENHCF